jgi:hypothetical protein
MPGFDYKGSYAYHISLVTHDRRPLLVDEDARLTVARYILGNPVEAGLIMPDEEWPFAGGSLLATDDWRATEDLRDGAKASSLQRAALGQP